MYFNTHAINRVGALRMTRAALACLFISAPVSGVYADTTLVFDDNLAPSNPFPATLPIQQATMATGVEFRVITDTGNVSGGGEKSIVGQSIISNPPSFTDGGPLLPTPPDWNYVTWIFNTGNELTTVINSDVTLGAPNATPPGCSGITTADMNGSVGLFRNALFLGANFGFLAPTVGSAAANTYGVGQLTSLTDASITIRIPVAEAQWAGCPFQLGGQNNVGITFSGAIAADKHTYRLTADHTIGPTGVEDSLGFAGQNTQWDLVGAVNSDPEPNITGYSTAPTLQLVIPLASLATDREGDALSISTTGARPVTGTAGGSASCTAADCTYNPAGSGGIDSFTVTVVDDFSVQGTVDITVNIAVTTAPVAVPDQATVDQDSVNNSIDVLTNDSPGANPLDPASVIVTVPPVNGSIGTLPGDGTVPYTPTTGFSGSDSFTYTVNDTSATTSNPAPVTVTVNCIDVCGDAGIGSVAAGSLTGNIRVTAADLTAAGAPPDDGADGVGTSCSPDCFDFVATTTGSQAVVVFALSGPLQSASAYRKFVNGQWVSFDTSSGDQVSSAPGILGSCPPPGDSAYIAGLSAGSFCLQLSITDGGPNDADSAPGQVTDPGGIGFGAANTYVRGPQTLSSTPSASSFGCTLMNSTAQSGQRGDWWLIMLLVIGLGGRQYLKRADRH